LIVNTPAGSAAGNSGPMVDLQDGVVVLNFGATYSTNITDAGNDWWRIAITFTKSGPVLQVDHNPLPTSTVAAYTGDGTSGVLLWGAQLEEGSTATTYIPTTTTISGAPRFDHDPVTGESLGLLIEESRTNFSKYSRRFDVISGDSWAPVAPAAVAGSTTTAPDGTSAGIYMADTITGATGTAFNTSVVKQVYTVPNNANSKYTFSVYIKLLTATQASIYIRDGATGSVSSASVENTSDWQRVVVTSSANLTNATPHTFYIGNTDGDITVWGSQIEKGAFSSSYITTDTSTVTRAADVASIEGTNFSSWYNQSEGTVFVAVDKAYKTNTIAAAFDDGSGANRIEVRSSGSSLSNARYVITDNSTTVYSKESSTAGANRLKLALAYKTGSVNNATNGVIDIVDATASIPNVSRLAFQNEFFLTDQRPGHIARLAYYPYRLADATLQEITS